MAANVIYNLDQLLAQAPAAVDSYFPGHWERMLTLERQASEIVAQHDIDLFPEFLCAVAFLKQPRTDHSNLYTAIKREPQALALALEALADIDRLDYKAMELLANVPGFGRRGGRAFTSAVLRLIRPERFGIIDWRNLAVLMSAHGFEGLLNSPMRFDAVSSEEVLRLKGQLVLGQALYQLYNDALRVIALSHGRTVAEIDLAIWTFSILKRPFSPFQPRNT